MNLNELIMKASDYTPAKKYLQDRRIPDEFIDDLYANPDCTVLWGEDNIEGSASEGVWIKAGVESAHGRRIPLGNEPRVVFPYYALGSAGNPSDLVGFTTRMLTPADDDGMRYQGKRTVTDAKLVFNGHKIDPSKTIFITEGEICSSHLPNACSTENYENLPVEWKPMAILVYDNDGKTHRGRNDREDAIAAGWTVVDWGTSVGHPYHKDINAMVMANMDTPQIVELIRSHI